MEQNENFEHMNDRQTPDVAANEQAGNTPDAQSPVTEESTSAPAPASASFAENAMPKNSMVHEKEPFVPEGASAVTSATPLQEPSQEQAPEVPKAAQKPPKQKKKKERKPRRKHYVARFFAAIFRFLLTLLLGMTIAYGSIFYGIYYAISGFTLSDLQAMGLAEGVEQYLTDQGEVDLTTVSLLELIADFNAVRADLGSHTLQTLITRYGVVLPEETMKKLPTDLFSVPLNTLLSSEVGTVVAENLKMGYILSFLPEGTLSAEAINTLAPRPISLLTEGKYGELLSGVKLGYVTGVKFNTEGDVVYENPYAPTTQEAMANLDLGTFFTAITQNGDILGAFATCLGDSRLKDVFSAISGGELFDKMLAGRLVKDVIILDEQTGQYTLSFTALASGMYLGDALGYTLVDGKWYSTYTDDGYAEDDVKVSSMNAALAGIALSDVLDGKLDIAATFDGLFFGDLQDGYVRGDAITKTVEGETVIVGYVWTKNGEAPSKVETELANIAIADVLNGTIDINGTLGTLYLGDLQGYTWRDITEGDVVVGHKWVKVAEDLTETELTAVEAALADLALSDALEGKLDIAKALNGLFFGDLQDGYVRGDAIIEAVEGEEVIVGYKWTKNGAELSKMEKELANIALADVLNGTIDINGTLGTLYLGDLQGYTRRDVMEGDVVVGHKWVKIADDLTETELSAMEAALADISLSDALNGTLDVKAALGDLTLGDVQGFTLESDGKWYKSEGTPPVLTYVGAVQNSLANTKLSDVLNGSFSISEAVSDLRLGDAMGYVRGDVITPADPLVPDSYDIFAFSKGTPAVAVTGAVLEVANMPLDRVLNGEADFADTIKSMPLGEVLEYTKHGDVWYVTYTDDGDDSNDVCATGILSLLADYPVREINATTVDSLVLGAVLGYEHRDTDEDGEGDTWYQGDAPAEGLLVAFADLTVGQLSDPDMMATKVRTLTLAEAMGYEKHGGIWYSLYSDDGDDTNDVKLTGILAVLAGKRLNEINSATIDAIKLGDAVGYTYVDTDEDGEGDTWYHGAVAAEGLMAVFADLTVGQLSDSDAVGNKVRTLTLAEAMGYEQHGGIWYSLYSDDGDDTNDVRLTGVLAVLAGKRLNEINSATIDGIKLGDALGYTYEDTNDDDVADAWCQDGVPAMGMTATMADLTIGQLRDGETVTAHFGSVHLYDVLGYRLEDGSWLRNSDDHKASGIIAHLIGLTISEVEAEIDDMPLGYAFNFYRDEDTGVWYTDAEHTVQPTGVTAALADIHLSSARDEFEGMKIGTLLGFVYVDTNDDDTPDTWQKKGGAALTGLDLVFADMLVSELGNTDNIAAAMQDAKLGDSMGFKKQDGKWYKSKTVGDALVADTTKPVTGLFGALADSSIGSIEADVQTVQIGVMLNYHKDGGKWYDSEGHEVTGMITAIADSTLQTVATDFEEIEIGQLFSTRSGIMAALPGTTKISELDSAVQALKIGQLYEQGIITLDDEVVTKLDNSLAMKNWRTMTIITFLEMALGALSQMP